METANVGNSTILDGNISLVSDLMTVPNVEDRFTIKRQHGATGPFAASDIRNRIKEDRQKFAKIDFAKFGNIYSINS